MRLRQRLAIAATVGISLMMFLPINAQEKHKYLQVAALSQAQSALHLQQQLQAQLHQPARVQSTDHNGKMLYRVQIGPLANGTDIPKLQQQIKHDAGLNSRPVVEQAQTTKVSATDKSENATRLWNLRDADIRSVIREVARETQRNFVIDPRVHGKISIISAKPINADELYQVFLAVLQVSGYSALPSNGVIKIVPNMDARTFASPVRSHGGDPRSDAMVVRVISLHFVPAEQIVPVLRPLLPQWSNVSAYAPSNSIIISGHQSNVERLAKIIARVDNPSSNGVDIVPLHNALAQDVAQTLENLQGKAQSPFEHVKVRVAADDRSNSLLISGNKAARLRMRVLISQLDTRSPRGSNGSTQVVFLHYRRAKDLAPILAGVAKANFSGSVGTVIGTMASTGDPMAPRLADDYPGNAGLDSNIGDSLQSGASVDALRAASSVSSASPQSAQTTSSSGDSKPKVQIIAEPNTNSIILNAPPTLMRILKSVIAKLDSRPAQVYIEALIAEVDEQDLTELGIDWGSLVNLNSEQGSTASKGFQPGFAILNSKTTIQEFAVRINALATLNKANILSRPSVVVLDNHQAKILVGQEVSVEQSTFPGNANGTTGATPYTTFARLNVALHLFVTPQISSDDSIQLQIDQGNDTLQNPNDTSGRPVVNKSSILTSVIINDGNVLVLGGLIQNQLQRNDRRIPILGDIPGLGKAFQNNAHSRNKKVLMVFLKPKILDGKREDIYVTNRRFHHIRQSQLDDIRDVYYHPENRDLILPKMHPVRLPVPFRRHRG